jgi:hypothetical protein
MNSLLLGLGLGLVLLPVNITLTMMSFRYDGKSVFMFIMSAMMINMFVSGTYVYLMANRVADLKEFMLGIGLIIITTMLCKVVMTMGNLHTSDQIKELKKLKAEITKLQNK